MDVNEDGHRRRVCRRQFTHVLLAQLTTVGDLILKWQQWSLCQPITNRIQKRSERGQLQCFRSSFLQDEQKWPMFVGWELTCRVPSGSGWQQLSSLMLTDSTVTRTLLIANRICSKRSNCIKVPLETTHLHTLKSACWGRYLQTLVMAIGSTIFPGPSAWLLMVP